MKRIFTSVIIVLFLVSSSVFLISWSEKKDHEKSSGGSPSGYAKDPAGGNLDCTECHVDGASSAFSQVRTGMITSDIPGSGYLAGNTYTITATVVQAGHTSFGFEVSPQNSGGTFLGTLISNTETQLVGANKYVTHNSSSVTGTNSRIWTFQWTAPATGLGPVTFYGAFNVCDDDGSDVGDSVYTSTMIVNEFGVGISQVYKPESQFSVYPVLSNGYFTVENKEYQGFTFDISIYKVTGEIVYQKKCDNIKELINLNQSSGIYYVSINTENSKTMKKIIIQ